MQTKLTWASSPDADVVGYMVRYGAASGRYDRSMDVGDATSATVTNLTVGGTYYFAVTAYNGARLESLPSNEVAIRIESLAPSVALTTPIEGAVIQVGTKLNIAAVASDQDGSIAKVEFYQGNQKIGEAVSAPYSIEWQVRKAGEVKLSARAIDSDGLRKVSDPVFISIRTANAPFTKGAYAGMIATPDEDVRYAGAFTLNTSATGVFTGSLKWNGVSYRLKGRLDGAGAATITIPRKNQTPLVVRLQLSNLADANGGIEGSVSDGATTGALAGDRSGGTKKARSLYAGKWTVFFRSPEPSVAGVVAPEGVGYGTIVVGTTGTARIKGALADGSPFSFGGTIVRENQWPVYVRLYRNMGAVAGLLQFGMAGEGTLSGEADWFKPSGLKGQKTYPDGFLSDLDVIGEEYRVPKKGQPPLNFTIGQDAGSITFSEGNLSGPLSKTLTVSKAGRVLVSASGPERVKLQINAGIGTFSGSFFDLSLRKTRRFSGALLQSQGLGGGFFLGDSETGRVEMSPNK